MYTANWQGNISQEKIYDWVKTSKLLPLKHFAFGKHCNYFAS